MTKLRYCVDFVCLAIDVFLVLVQRNSPKQLPDTLFSCSCWGLVSETDCSTTTISMFFCDPNFQLLNGGTSQKHSLWLLSNVKVN